MVYAEVLEKSLSSGYITVQHNRVYNVPTPMNFNNRNQNRIDTCIVRDNEFEEKKN